MRTISSSTLDAPSEQNLLSGLPCGGQGKQVWSALEVIGRQLQILARAQMGPGSFSAYVQPAPLASQDTLTASELVSAFLRAKARAGRSDRYLRAARYNLKKFVARFGSRLITEITVADVEHWLTGFNVHGRTAENYLCDVRTAFNFAVKRGLMANNPAAGVELPDYEAKATALHSPEQARAAMEFALRYDLNICRALAIRYFAGLRSCEVERISEERVLENYIEVTAGEAKGGRARRRRLVTIQPNLREWLKLGGTLPAPPQNGRRMLEFMRSLKASGLEWPENVTRHSFCSYHLAQFRKASETALEAGHTEQMLFANYRELCTPEAAAEFWAILPPSQDKAR